LARGAIEREQQAFSKHINMFFSDGVGGYDADLTHLLAIDAQEKEIFTKVQDGFLLAKLINATTPGTLDLRKLNQKPKNTWQLSENLNMVIAAAKTIGCKVVNLGAEDIIKANEVLVLGLIWQIVRLQLTKDIQMKESRFLYHLLEEDESRENFEKLPPESLLLRWFNFHLAEAGSDRRLRNFGDDLRDAEPYRILLNQLEPDLSARVQVETTAAACAAAAARSILASTNDVTSCTGGNNCSAFDTASVVIATARRMGVRCFISAEDICSGNSRLNMAFTAQIFNHKPGMLLSSSKLQKLRAPFNFPSRRVFAKLRSHVHDHKAVVTIQAAYRAHLARGDHPFHSILRNATRAIQRAYRSYRGRTEAQWLAVVEIQRVARGVLTRSKVTAERERLEQLNATMAVAPRVQAAWRGWLARRWYRSERGRQYLVDAKTAKIQALVRGVQQKRRYRRAVDGITKLQALVRGVQQKQRYQTARNGMIKLQALVRGVHQRAQLQKVRRGVEKLQALVRGILARSGNSEIDQLLRAIRQKLVGVNARAREGGRSLTIGGRAIAAMHALLVLKKNKTVTEMIAACKTLEMATRLSPVCCRMFVTELSAVPLLYSLTRMCNRSVPHFELLTHCLHILRNLCRCRGFKRESSGKDRQNTSPDGGSLVAYVAAPGWNDCSEDKKNTRVRLGRESITTMKQLANEVAAHDQDLSPKPMVQAPAKEAKAKQRRQSDGSSGVPFVVSKASTNHMRGTQGVATTASDDELILGVVNGKVRVAKLDAPEVLVDLVQMFREKEETFSLALGILKRVNEYRANHHSSDDTTTAQRAEQQQDLRRRLGLTLHLLEKKQARSSDRSESGKAVARCVRRLKHVLELMGGGYSHPGLLAVQEELREKALLRMKQNEERKPSTTAKAKRMSFRAAVDRVRAHRKAENEKKRREERRLVRIEEQKKQHKLELKKQLQQKLEQRKLSLRRKSQHRHELKSQLQQQVEQRQIRRNSTVRLQP
jgi:hypothetical protein